MAHPFSECSHLQARYSPFPYILLLVLCCFSGPCLFGSCLSFSFCAPPVHEPAHVSFRMNSLSSDRSQVRRVTRLLLFCVGCAIVGLTLLAVSFVRARTTADALIAKIPERWEPYSSRFCPIFSVTGRWGPSWDFSYEPRDYLPVGPTTLNVTLSGEVVASNPNDILPRLKALP